MARARYTVEHETLYTYTAPVSQSWQLARLKPRELPWQRLLDWRLTIDPEADESHEAVDSFGNTVTHFGLHRAHRLLRVTLRCAVEVGERPTVVPTGEAEAAAGPAAESWEAVRDGVRRQPAQDGLAPARLSEPTRLLPLSDAAQAYAAISGRDFVVPDDVKALAGPTLAHRLILQPQARLKDLAQTTVIAEVLASVPVETAAGAALRA